MKDRATTPENAPARYAHYADEAKRLLDAICAAIGDDDARIEKREGDTGRRIDWADVGSMNEVARKLREIADFFGAK